VNMVKKTYHVTFKVVTFGVCLLKHLCSLNDIKLFMEKDCRSIEELNEERWFEYFLWMRMVICLVL